MLWDALHFFIGLIEVIVAVALILIAGVTVAKIAFWILSRFLGKFGGPLAGLDSQDDEIDECIVIPNPPDDIAVPAEDGR
jgi:hypothetical protein